MSDPKSSDCDDVEITPEMIEAGLRELAYFDPEEDPAETWGECVTDIYRAMRSIAER